VGVRCNYGNLATIGRKAAIIDFGWVHLRGLVACVMWSVVHIYFFNWLPQSGDGRTRLAVGIFHLPAGRAQGRRCHLYQPFGCADRTRRFCLVRKAHRRKLGIQPAMPAGKFTSSKVPLGSAAISRHEKRPAGKGRSAQ
jgi:hypothetical protein